MAQTFGAIAEGLRIYRPGLQVHGVAANRIAGARHAQMLEQSLRAPLRFLGALPRSAEITLPERHLGLVQGFEVSDLQARLNAAASAWLTAPDLQAVPFSDFQAPPAAPIAAQLRGVRIAVARDAAFSFLYPANLEILRALGAELRFVSPLSGAPLPDCDAIYLPGGYPELHAAQLAGHAAWWQALRAHHAAAKPIVAECGGMMTVFEALVDREGRSHPMAGLLPGFTAMQPRLQALGLQAVECAAGPLRGHTFHHSRLETPLHATLQARSPDGATGEGVFQQARLTASYVHFYFASNPPAAAELFQP
jgi:cobyrinic acid a,c-diamide synthase